MTSHDTAEESEWAQRRARQAQERSRQLPGPAADLSDVEQRMAQALVVARDVAHRRFTEPTTQELTAAAMGVLLDAVYSGTSTSGSDGGIHRRTWEELYRSEHDEVAYLQEWRTMCVDLDRNAHGRHSGDIDSSDPTGASQGNPHLVPGQVLGYTISGAPIVLPDRQHIHDLAAWFTPQPDADDR